MGQVTDVLGAVGQGDGKAAEELLALLYGELRQMASRQMAVETGTQTLQATALVHEAWLRLAGKGHPRFANRAHFFAAAAEAMRRILIENARRKRAVRHGGGMQRVDVHYLEIACPTKDEELLAVDAALEQFARQDKQKAELVKLRYFVGFTLEEAAGILGVSVPTARRWWTYARAWLFREISAGQGREGEHPREP
jgi:RNA polymerase sigma factor (TIGR02999 family)